MRSPIRLAGRAAIVAALLGVTIWGLAGAYGYGRDYDLHRGFAGLVALPRAGTGRLQSVHFHSAALRRRADYLVYLPPGYTTSRRYPVYYLLHGMPGQPSVFVTIANMDVRLDNQLSLGRARPMILVYPDGRIDGDVFSDSEWANTPAGAFESYVIEVVHDVDRRFSTLPDRSGRVIAGFSAGAYGAVNIALHHLADFANVQTWSGYFTQTRTGVFAHATPAELSYNSPLHYVETHGRALAADPLRAYMFVGRDDESSAQQPAMVQALRRAGADVSHRLYPGGHDWSVWYPRLNQMLDLASRDTLHPPRLHRTSAVAEVRPDARTRAHRDRHHEPRLLGALLLALASGALINLGFVLQHRGHAQARALGRRLIDGLRSRSWLGGQLLGWAGFAGQIVAVALAPLTLVQAFAAGSLAISVPIAARMLGHRVPRDQLVVVGLIALSLASLPIGFGGGRGQLQAGALIGGVIVASIAGIALGLLGRPAPRAIAAGLFYGAADAAIKADALGLRHGAGALLSGWTILAALGTLGGFVTLQAALRGEDAVQPLSLMNAFTAVTAVGLGIGAFGEPLGAGWTASVAHGLAIVVVLGCVRPLARAQQRLVPGGPLARASAPAARASASPARARVSPVPARRAILARAWRALALSGTGVLVALVVIVACLAATGLLYGLRGVGWLALGPSVPDALPLLQLAGFAGQPLGRVMAASIPVGLALGVALVRLAPARRLLAVGAPAVLLMLLASDASFALARNLGLGHVLLDRAPGLGPWTQALLVSGACALPGLARGVRSPIPERPPPRTALRPAGVS